VREKSTKDDAGNSEQGNVTVSLDFAVGMLRDGIYIFETFYQRCMRRLHMKVGHAKGQSKLDRFDCTLNHTK
jgi:hypothetical protein